MEISFREKKLRKICEDKQMLQKRFGECAVKISQRLGEFLSAESLHDIKMLPGPRLHPLQGNYSGYFALDVKQPYRIIFKPLNGDLNDLKTITTIEIFKIEDYH